eukprot:6182000-Pleurochrysis_carterae.AAC.3
MRAKARASEIAKTKGRRAPRGGALSLLRNRCSSPTRTECARALAALLLRRRCSTRSCRTGS